MATFEELQRVCKHHRGRADDFEGMETPIQNHTLRCWNCLVSLEPIPADVVAHYEEGARLLNEAYAHEQLGDGVFRVVGQIGIDIGRWLVRDAALLPKP